MLSGSAILRVAVLVVAAAVLAGALQWYWWSAGGDASTEAAPAPKSASRPAAKPATQRSEPAAPAPPQPVAPAAPSESPPPPPSPPPVAEAPPPVAAPPPQSAAEIGQGAVDAATESAGPRALAIVDLNTGTLAELNRLKGGGAIGRAIIQRRPYASVDQLLSKRVLSRATYEKIKDQVTVR